MVKPMNIDGIAEATGKSWDWWCKALEKSGAENLNHAEIAKLVPTLHAVSGWWAQGVTVAFEQHIGRRVPGQMSDGSYSASITRIVHTAPAASFKTWKAFAADVPKLGSAKVDGTPKTSETPVSRNWRCALSDGSRVAVSFSAKVGSKTLVAVEHRKLPSPTALAESKDIWRKLFADCFG